MYEPLLIAHSWTRWMVLGGLVYFFIKSIYSIVRKKAWTGADNYFIWAFEQAFGYQVLFGLVLWLGSSPFLKMAIRNPDLVFEDSTVSFWSLRHPLTMLVSIVVFQIGKVRARRAPMENKFRIFAVTFAVVLILVCSAIPWSWLSYGRPWLRF